MRGRANKADILVRLSYRPPNQDEETDKAFCEQLAEVAWLPVLVHVVDFNFSDICQKYKTVWNKQPKRFLECIEDNFLMQLIREATGEMPH